MSCLNRIIQSLWVKHVGNFTVYDPVPNLRFAIDLQLKPSVALKLVLILISSVNNSFGVVSNRPQGVGTKFCNLVMSLSKTSLSTGFTKSPSSATNCELIQLSTKESTLETASFKIRALLRFYTNQRFCNNLSYTHIFYKTISFFIVG